MIAAEPVNDLQELRDEIPKYLRDEYEKSTLAVRDSFTFPGWVEVTFACRLGLIRKENLPAIRQNGLEIFLLNWLDKVRDRKTPQHLNCPECRFPRHMRYTYSDVLREIYYVLREILEEAGKAPEKTDSWGQAEIKKLSAYLVAAVNTHERENRVLAGPLDVLKLTSKVQRAIETAGILTVGDLVSHTEDEILAIDGVSTGSKNQLRDSLWFLRLKFREEAK